MIKSIMKSVFRIVGCVFVLALMIGTGCINSIMFHPEMCRGGYRETTSGYVDIGTNGVRIAAVVRGPFGRFAISASAHLGMEHDRVDASRSDHKRQDENASHDPKD